jgi:hypothetical protein
MLSSLRTQPTTADPLAEPPAAESLARLSALHEEFSVAAAQASRRRMRNLLIVANALAWVVMVVVVRLMFF